MGDALNARQIGLLRDVRSMGIMAFFDSRFRSEGPGLRELGMIGGIGDSTGLTADGLAAVQQADAMLSAHQTTDREDGK